MGKPTAEQSSDKPYTTHFSHPHPLQLSNLQQLAQILHCSACNLAATGSAYTCTSNCNFILHPHCFQLPPQIKHSFDQLNHDLFLLPKPIYPEGLFRCDGCGNQGGGFSYHCSPCGIDLHTTCASLTMKLGHQSHHHELILNFTAPYAGNEFTCDICKRVGSKSWIYRCGICEFDVHLTCVATVVPVQAPHMVQQAPPQIVHTRAVVIPTQPAVNPVYPPNAGGYGVPRPPPLVVMGQAQNAQVVGNPYPAAGVPQTYGAPPSRPRGGLGDQIMIAAVNGVASGVAQSATDAIIQGVFGGGGGGGGGAQIDGGYGGTDGGGAHTDGGYGGTDGGYGGEEPSYYVE